MKHSKFGNSAVLKLNQSSWSNGQLLSLDNVDLGSSWICCGSGSTANSSRCMEHGSGASQRRTAGAAEIQPNADNYLSAGAQAICHLWTHWASRPVGVNGSFS